VEQIPPHQKYLSMCAKICHSAYPPPLDLPFKFDDNQTAVAQLLRLKNDFENEQGIEENANFR